MTQSNGEKSVCFIVPRMSGGGAERVISLIANGMVEKGICVSIAFSVTQTVSYELNSAIELIANFGNHSPLGQIGFIRSLMKKRRNTVFVSFFTYQNIYTLLARTLLRCKVVVSERNDPKTTIYRHKYLGILRNHLYPKAYKIIFQTEAAMNYFPEKVRSRGCLIANPLPPNLPKVFTGEREKKIVAVSRINKQKNLSMMINGLSPILKRRLDYTLEIYGDALNRNGPAYEELKSLIAELKLDKQVVFKGFVNNVAESIKNACLYVNTSDYEGISNSMLEALALGIPSVCTDCPVGGAKMFVQQGVNGYLVSVGNIAEFTTCVEKAIENRVMLTQSIDEAEKLRRKLNLSNIVDEWCTSLGI